MWSEIQPPWDVLSVVLPRQLSKGTVHVIVEAKGVEVLGEEEWNVRQHGYSKRRTLHKPHWIRGLGTTGWSCICKNPRIVCCNVTKQPGSGGLGKKLELWVIAFDLDWFAVDKVWYLWDLRQPLVQLPLSTFTSRSDDGG